MFHKANPLRRVRRNTRRESLKRVMRLFDSGFSKQAKLVLQLHARKRQARSIKPYFIIQSHRLKLDGLRPVESNSTLFLTLGQ